MHNPYNYHIAVRDDAMFFGRDKLFDRLVRGLCAPLPLSAAIFGGRRCGKTSLLSKLARVLRGQARAAGGRLLVPCSLDLQRGRPLTCSDDFFLWVLEELGEAWEKRLGLERGAVVDVLQAGYRDEMNKGPVDAFVHAFRSLDLGGERVRLVILIDESEEILAVEWGEDLRPNLRALLSNSPVTEDVALVMAGSTQMYSQVTERDSPLENILDRYLLPPLSHEATLALARQPNEERLSKDVAQEVWRQSGGHPCLAQYILHELWNELEGELADATAQDVQDMGETFNDRTRHFFTWAGTLGATGNTVYRFLTEQDVREGSTEAHPQGPQSNDAPLAYAAIRQHFSRMESGALGSALDALHYHGLIHLHGRGRRRQYQVAGQTYRDWFLAAGKIGAGGPLPGTARLHRILANRLDMNEFRTLCFYLNMNADNLGGKGLSGQARELIQYLEKRKDLRRLVEWLRRVRPDIEM